MLQIFIRTVDLTGEVLNTAISASDFKERADAVTWLNKLVDERKPEAGYNEEHDYWWIRQGNTIDRYTIGS